MAMMILKSSKVSAAGLIAIGVAMLAPSGDTLASGADPFSLYGERIYFDVYRNDKRVGAHEVRFRRDGNQIVADSSFDLSLRILGLFTYTYSYQSSEKWENNQLVALNATIDDNGDISSVRVDKTDGQLQVIGPTSQEIGVPDLFPTTHWNSNVVGATQIINTITGSINEVTMVDMGRTEVPAGDTLRPATHFAYQGELSTEVWYDDEGRWVKMRFPGSDGTMIEYRCQVCGHTVAADGSPALRSDAEPGNGG